MVELTRENHFKYGFNGTPFTERQSDEDVWYVEYGTAQYRPLSFRQECITTAYNIADHTSKQLFLCFSGGIDSEVVANSFYAARIPFKPVIVRYNNNLNDHDTAYAFQWCRDRNIEPLVIDFDVKEFWQSKLFFEDAVKYRCISPQFLVYLQILKKIQLLDGYPIFGSGECHLEKWPHINDNRPHMFEREKVASLYRFMQKNEMEGCPGFFQFTPELMLSYLIDHYVRGCIMQPDFVSSWDFKAIAYGRHFDLQPRKKFTGFEHLLDQDEVKRNLLTAMMPTADSIVKTDYVTLVRHLCLTAD